VIRRLELALLAVVGLAGCTAILDPERIDNVFRCEFDGQCPLHPDPRFTHVCTTADETLDASKICAPEPDVSCDPHDYDRDTEFVALYYAVTGDDDRYESHCAELGGVQGCPPSIEGCEAGLRRNAKSGRCDDDDPATMPALAAVPEVSGQDVLDQFCRSTFCSQHYVCDTREHRCVPCTIGDSLGRGGCGDLYIEGQRSSVYLSEAELEDECMGSEADERNIAFGPL
jgi:hypothetical protein